jgi:hypothetical protein
MNELADKVAIITGGGHGIGKEIALAYGKAGAKIVIAARSADPMKQTCAELERAGARAIYLETDVSKEADCAKMADEATKAFGRIDILVNNAGISGPTKRITEMSLAEWNETIDIDLTGTWLATRAVLPTMDKQRTGNVINISSGAGRRGFPLRAVRRREVGDDRPHPDHCRRMGPARNPMQLHMPGRNRRRANRTRDARARRGPQAAVRADPRSILVASRDEPDGDRRGSRARRLVPRDRSVGRNDRSNHQRRLRQHHELKCSHQTNGSKWYLTVF